MMDFRFNSINISLAMRFLRHLLEKGTRVVQFTSINLLLFEGGTRVQTRQILVSDKETIKRRWLVFPMSAPRGLLEKPPGVTDCFLATGGFQATALIRTTSNHVQHMSQYVTSPNSACNMFDERKYDRQPEKKIKQLLQKVLSRFPSSLSTLSVNLCRRYQLSFSAKQAKLK